MSTGSPHGMVEYRTNYRWSVIVVTALCLVLFYRFLLLQVVRGSEYQKEQAADYQRSDRIPAPRGWILDRNGKVLAKNIPTYDLIMRPSKVKRTNRSEELLRRLLRLNDDENAQLRELIKTGMELSDRYRVVPIRRDLVSDFCPFDNNQLTPLIPKQKSLWCQQCGRNYRVIDAADKKCPRDSHHKLHWNKQHTGATCSECPLDFTASSACPHDGAPLRKRHYSLQCHECGRTFNNEKAVIEAALYEMPGFEIRSRQRRVYPHGHLTAHITGYINQVNARDLKRYPKRYKAGDLKGRSGVEWALEDELRGVWGKRNYLLENTQEGPMAERTDPRRPDLTMVDGHSVRLTIDLELQRLAKRALLYHRSGAVVVVDVRNGEILALYSKPGFDPNLWSGRLSAEDYRSIQSNPYTPMLNKALTSYAPGSVYKIVTATAGLHTATMTPSEEITCHGFYEFGGRRFRCHNRVGHGSLDLVHAMSRSCDIYFYRLGEMVGMDSLHHYATKYFGFGQSTGIEITESHGVVPDKEWHRKKEKKWMPGFTLSTAVGQKDIKSTPLQMARAFLALANKGKLLDVHIVNQLEDLHGNVMRVVRPNVAATLPLTADEISIINEGLWRVVNDEHGTAFSARLSGIEVSGKTGTAEAAERKPGVSDQVAKWLKEDHAWFIGFAPSRKPEIVVTVFLEHGHSGGKVAAPVAMRVFKGYFSKRAHKRRTPQNPLPNPITAPGPSDKKQTPKINQEPIDLP